MGKDMHFFEDMEPPCYGNDDLSTRIEPGMEVTEHRLRAAVCAALLQLFFGLFRFRLVTSGNTLIVGN